MHSYLCCTLNAIQSPPETSTVSCPCLNKQGGNHFTDLWQNIKDHSSTAGVELGRYGPTVAYPAGISARCKRTTTQLLLTGTHTAFPSPLSSCLLKTKKGGGGGQKLLSYWCGVCSLLDLWYSSNMFYSHPGKDEITRFPPRKCYETLTYCRVLQNQLFYNISVKVSIASFSQSANKM